MFSLVSYEAVGPFGSLALVSLIYTATHRLYLSPLSSIPGPRVAALTFCYEIYFNIVKPGMFVWEIQRLHEIYGMPQSVLG